MTVRTSNHLRRAVLGGLAALSVMAGSGLALAPREAQAVGGNVRVLYTYQYRDSAEDARARFACLNAASAYNADYTEASVVEHVHTGTHGGGQIIYILTCTGHFGTEYGAPASTGRRSGR